MSSFCELMVLMRPGFCYHVAMGGDEDDLERHRVIGARGDSLLVAGRCDSGWINRADLAQDLLGATPGQSLRRKLQCLRGGESVL